MGAEGIDEGSSLSVLANNYMEKRIMKLRGITKAHPHLTQRRMEMTRYSLEKLREDTGVGCLDVQTRMTDFGIDAPWLSHEPLLIPEPLTPEAGELWSKEDIDYWCDALEQVVDEAYTNPELVKTAPHNQAIHKINAEALDDPEQWAMTWRAYQRKQKARKKGKKAATTARQAAS
jgi:glycine dehydrogenase subunit 2